MDNCPHCKTSLIGDPIPEDIAEHYSGTHWRREIGFEDPTIYDGTIKWVCPDCGGSWPSEVGRLKGIKPEPPGTFPVTPDLLH